MTLTIESAVKGSQTSRIVPDRRGKWRKGYDQGQRICWHEGLAVVRREGKFGYVDLYGNEVIPLKYKRAERFIEGWAFVWLGVAEGLTCGVIDQQGNEIVPIEYASVVQPESSNLFWVEKMGWGRGQQGMFNRQGEVVIPVGKYDDINYQEIDPRFNRLIQVEKDGSIGLVDEAGREVVRPKYRSVVQQGNGLAEINFNGMLGFVDHRGNEYFNVTQAEALQSLKVL